MEVSVLCPEDLLLHLCLHASKHQLDIGLKPFFDIFETIRLYGEEIDWNQVRICSGQAGITNGVYLALRLARELLGTPVPETFLDAIKPDYFDERFIEMGKRRIFANGQRSTDGLLMANNIAQLFGSKRFIDRVALFLKRIFLPREEMAGIYPASSDSPRIFLYYPARIKDLLLRHGRQVWRLVRRNEGMEGLVNQENETSTLRNWLMSKG
jgi:hypothetical protein